jgi:hypothetical protein
LIPAVICWQSPARLTFIIDGAHRLSAIIAWILDDYGAGAESIRFYGKIPDEQERMHNKTRELVSKRVGSYIQWRTETMNPGSIPELKQKVRALAHAKVPLLWVPGNDATKAEKAFFTINQSAVEIDATELKILNARSKPNAVAARSIVRNATGTKYWESFSADGQKSVVETARSIYSALYSPPLQTPPRTEELPVAGHGYAQHNSLEDDEFEYQLLTPIAEFVDELASVFLSKEELTEKHTLWAHRASPLEDISAKKTPHIDRTSLGESVRMYVNLPIRHQRVDRCLIDALIAQETFAFGEQMLNEPRIPGLTPRSPLRRSHPLWAFVKEQLANFIFACVLFALALIPYRLGWIAEGGLAIVFVCLGGLFFLGFLLGLIFLPSFWKQQKKATQTIGDLIQTMVAVYAELNSSTGLVSARHFRERASKASDKGVTWPSGLFVLLDDVEARNGRF